MVTIRRCLLCGCFLVYYAEGVIVYAGEPLNNVSRCWRPHLWWTFGLRKPSRLLNCSLVTSTVVVIVVDSDL